MAEINFDPELMQDFLTESGELLEQLDQDLVLLESTPEDLELLNRIFRALHTIKGSASFIQLTNLVNIAHAAETCLNAARNRVFVVDRRAMDQLLAAVDVVKQQFEDIRANRDLTSADPALVASLTALGEGKGVASPSHPTHATPAASVTAPTAVPAEPTRDAPGAPSEPADGLTEKALQLSSGKADLLDFLVADVETTLQQLERQIQRLSDDALRPGASSAISELAESLSKSADFFEFEPMSRLSKCLVHLGEQCADMPSAAIGAVRPDVEKVIGLLKEQSKGLSQQKLVERPIDGLCARFEHLAEQAPGDAMPKATNPDQPGSPSEPADAAPTASVKVTDAAGEKAASGDKHADQTIRVEVGRLEALLNLVGELVLQKNRVSALTRQVSAMASVPQALREQVVETSGSLDRVTSDLQVAVMKTRMQPLEKLFGKYPRLIRDLSRKLNKQINLVIEGGDTEVDKSVIEELGDPLVHLMRNATDHGIEMPEARKAAGKPEVGTIRLSASHEGSHVRIAIQDDGKGLRREVLVRKAIEKGLYTAEQLDQMSDQEVHRIIFMAGFSTAEVVSDVSGRGVGMDVVRSNIEKLKGSIDLFSEPGKGCTVAVKIPLTVAILSAMMVGVGDEIYAIPLTSVTEIVKPTDEQLASISQSPVMRLRDTVLPLLAANQVFSVPAATGKAAEAPFAVVLTHNQKRVGLMVTRLIGQQEVVIKPLDGFLDKGGPVSGATVRDDGGVSLIVDVPRLFALASQRGQSERSAS